MTALERLHEALDSSEPARALRATAVALAGEGRTQPEVYGLLEELLLALRARPEKTEAQEEIILDLMDSVNGWCHPSASLFADDERG
jgi:hypothetical protein